MVRTLMTQEKQQLNTATDNRYRIDYSKWDKIGEDDSDDDNNSEDRSSQRHDQSTVPHVTRLDHPTSVTFGGMVTTSTSPLPLQPQAQLLDPQSQLTTQEAGVLRPPQNFDASSGGRAIRMETAAKDVDAENKCSTLEKNTTNGNCSTIHATANNNVPSSWTEKGSAVIFPNVNAHGERDDQVGNSSSSTSANCCGYYYYYYWSQDRLAVHVRVPLLVPPSQQRSDDNNNHYDSKYDSSKPVVREPLVRGTYTIDVSVTNVLPYTQRHCALLSNNDSSSIIENGKNSTEYSSTQHFKIELKLNAARATRRRDPECSADMDTTTILLQGELLHPVYYAQDDDDTIDWSIQHHDAVGQYVLVTLYKATPMQGMTLWWKKLLREHPTEIELTWVQRNNPFQQAWDQAHAQFFGQGPFETKV